MLYIATKVVKKNNLKKLSLPLQGYTFTDRMNTYYIIMGCMAVMAVIVFVALFFFKAGYGYLSTSNWGPKISNRTAWVLMEAPAFRHVRN